MSKKTFTRKAYRIYAGLIFLFSLLIAFNSDLGSADFNLKCIGGWSYSNLNREGIDGINSITFGMGLELWTFEYLGLEIDILYVRKGYYSDPENSDKTFTEISIPLLIKSKIPFGADSQYAFNIFGGLEYSPILTEMDPNYGQHDFGIVVGGSLERWFKKISLFIESRYDWGLLNQSDEYLPWRFEFKTRTFFLMTGIKIKL
jgi:hypothetical protein